MNMQIEIWSDVVCPWCFIGKRRFEAALEKVTSGPDAINQPIEIVYRAYQLDPTAPANSSAPVREVYAKKFGGADRADKIIAQLTETAALDGIEFRMDIGQRSNTILAHRLMWWTGVNHDYGVQSRLKENLLNAYFTNGVNVGDSEELIAIGVHTIPHESDDLEFAEFLRAFFASDAGKGEVAEELATAVSHGITGVPTYVINGQWSIPGAQDSETFERVLRRTAERMGT
jgi:predicted DsbA family dithiol-disulfide isomerase